MKKLLIILSPLFAIFASLFLPLNVNAACYPVNPSTGVCDSIATCPVGSVNPCCDTIGECRAAPTLPPAPTSPPPGSITELMCLGGDGINTAIGCIPINNSSALLGFILRWAIGIGGGIAFILILVAGFQIMTSQGDPQRLQAGKELLTSAIVGLVLIIFSVFILEIIGVDILTIPGFNQ